MKLISEKQLIEELGKISYYYKNNETNSSQPTYSKQLLTMECIDTNSESNDIILDIEDINYIIKKKDILAMSSSTQYGIDSAKKAIESIIFDIKNNISPIDKADGAIVFYQVNSDYKTAPLIEAMMIMNDTLCKEADVIFGITCDDKVKNNFLKATVFISYTNGHNAVNNI